MGAVFLLPAEAATVEVSVRERQGGLLADQTVILLPMSGAEETPFWDRRRMQGVTGSSGRVTFDAVPVGRFTVTLGGVGAGLIHPSANASAPPPQITITSEKDKVAVEIEVWRGSLLSGEIITDRAPIPKRAKAVLRSLDGQPTVDLALDALGHVDRLLLPGRYEVELEAPPGYLLVDLVFNGESLPGHVVRFDIREDPRKQSVSWYLSSTCLITGKISDDGGGCPARVVATLVQPGAWIQAVTQRGGSTFQVVPNQEWDEHTPCVYRLWLPDGQWTVQPQGGGLLSSDPEKADVAISPWETRTLDFRVTTQDDDAKRGAPLIVTVQTEEGRRIEGATVEIRTPGGSKPLRTGKTERFGGIVIFRGVAAGDYRVLAGHDDFLVGWTDVEDFNPKASEPRRVTVTLREGAKLHAHAVDETGRAVQGVELSYAFLGRLPAVEGIFAKKKAGAVLSDVTGHAEVSGLYSGDYRLEARMTGERSATRFVVFRGHAKDERSIEVHLEEGHREDVELQVLPAASLSGGLRCSDRGTMPPRASFRIFASDTPVQGLWRDEDLSSGAELAPNDVVLRGANADRFHLGPLSPGSYRLAARPAGQRYWSWASNEVVPDPALVFPLVETDVVDAGLSEIECGPLIAVVPEIKSKEPIPDLHLGAVRASLAPAGEKGGRGVVPDVEVHADRVFLRRLQEGKFKTALTVEHPYLIPSSMTVPEQVLDLLRGSFTPIPVTFERLGGMVEVHGEGIAARVTSTEREPVTRPLVEGKANFPGTIPGTYQVEMCDDVDCSTVTTTWTRVYVAAAKTTFLP